MLEVPSKEEFNKWTKIVQTLKEEVEQLKSLPPPPEWYTVEQAARALDRCNITVREMARRGDLVYKREGRKIEISSDSIRKWNLKITVK